MLYKGFYHPPPTPLSFRACVRGVRGLKWVTTPSLQKKEKAPGFGASRIVGGLLPGAAAESGNGDSFAGKCIRTFETLIAY